MSVKWNVFEENLKNKKIVCYGAGVNASFMLVNDKFLKFLDNVVFFVDKDETKTGTLIKTGKLSFEVRGLSELDTLNSDYVVIVTITDYLTVGEMLDEKKLEWYPWTIISTEFNFEKIKNNNEEVRLFLLNTPDYINLGDQAIALAEENYLKSNFGTFYEFGTHACHTEALSQLVKYVKPNDVIFFQGGGNLGSLWRVCEEIFRDVLKKFPDNTVIVFPQSVFYGDTEEECEYFEKSKEIYNSHKDLLICVRDNKSYDFVTKNYGCSCLLLPDMALTLNVNITSDNRNKIGVLLRNDKEQYIDKTYHITIDRVVSSLNQEVLRLTHHPLDIGLNRKDRVENILKKYSSCSVVITDRLHGMIFSAITSTPCIVFDNSYHKVFGVYKAWLSGFPNIIFTEMIDENDLRRLVVEQMNSSYKPYSAIHFDSQFNILTQFINKKIKKRG